MKYITVISVLIICILTYECGSKKVLYDLPSTMTAIERSEYEQKCEKGKILYGISCAKCHTTKVKGKKVIDDFNPFQLEGYKLRISNSAHMANLHESNVSLQELDLIITFLTFKKRNVNSK